MKIIESKCNQTNQKNINIRKEIRVMAEKLFLNAHDVAEMLGVSDGKAYQIIRVLNKEMKDQGYLVVQGKINKQYFEKKVIYQN